MLLLKTIGIFIMIISYGQWISSATDDNRYCNLESRCVIDDIITSPLHIGCPKSFANSPSLYKLIKLKHLDREFIANEFNQFRSDIAMGAYSKIFKYPLTPMNKLEWSHELEYLVSLMISKVPNTNFYCMATEISNRPSQLYVSIDRPQVLNVRKVFTLAINEIKVKALESFRDANIGDTVNWSQIYDIDTWAVGCAIGEFNSINVNDKLLIRCSFYGSKHNKQNFTTTIVDTACPYKKRNSATFPGLCAKDELKIMEGDIGPNGLEGNIGQTGAVGEKGDPGKPGDPGENGIVGSMGDPGIRGPQGDVGPTNITGAQGGQGETGECITGPPGLQGPPGNPGHPGKIGLKGEKGEKGPQGESVSLNTLTGEPGDPVTGSKGAKGEKGDKGNQGKIGARGLKGEKGEVGKIEYEGDKCVICPSKQGIQGPRGPQGEIGPSGTVEYEQTSIDCDVTTKRTDDW